MYGFMNRADGLWTIPGVALLRLIESGHMLGIEVLEIEGDWWKEFGVPPAKHLYNLVDKKIILWSVMPRREQVVVLDKGKWKTTGDTTVMFHWWAWGSPPKTGFEDQERVYQLWKRRV